MGRKCCVMNCNGNYDADNKESTFRLPADEGERARWLASIPRDNIPDSKNTVVCERHWPSNYAAVTIRGKKRPADPPSIFNCVKRSQWPTAPPPPRQTRKALSVTRRIDIDQQKVLDKVDIIKEFAEIKEKIDDKLDYTNFSVVRSADTFINLRSMYLIQEFQIFIDYQARLFI